MKQFLVIQSVGQIYDLGSWKFSKHIGAHTFILLSTQLLGTIYSNAIPILESNQRSAHIQYERYDLRPYTYIILSWGLWCSTDAQDLGRLACCLSVCLSICLSAMLISWHHAVTPAAGEPINAYSWKPNLLMINSPLKQLVPVASSCDLYSKGHASWSFSRMQA